MHFPEFIFRTRKFRGFRGGFRVGVHLAEREIAEYESQPFPKVFLPALHDRVTAPTVRTLIIAVFHQGTSCSRSSLHVVMLTNRDPQAHQKFSFFLLC